MKVTLGELVAIIGTAIKAGEYQRAETLLDQLEGGLAPSEADLLAPIVASLRSDIASRQGDEAAARRHSGRAFAAGDSPFRFVALSHEASIELKAGNLAAAESLYLEALALSDGLGDDLVRGNIKSDLSMIAYQRGEDEAAKKLMNEAHAHYRVAGAETKAADCIHVLGVMARNEGDADTGALMIQLSLGQAIEADDLQAIERRAGDLAHAHARREGDGAYESARDAINIALLAGEKLWARAREANAGYGARVERAMEMLNNLEIAVLVEEKGPEPLDAWVHVARTKARVLREDLSNEATARLIESYRSRHEGLKDRGRDALAASALPYLLGDLAVEGPLAFVDHFAMTAGDTLCVAQVAGPGALADLVAGRVRWPGPQGDEHSSRGIRGAGQGSEARTTAAEVLKDLEDYVDRAPYLLDQTGAADADAMATMKDDAALLAEPLSLLGRWLFPKEVRLALEERDVRHVFVAPDPRLFTLPWLALTLDDGRAIIDQPWTVSIVPSAHSLYDVARRRMVTTTRRLVVLAPDPDMNERMGGAEEAAAIRALYPSAEVLLDADATTTRAALALSEGAWLHVRTHGTLGADGAHVPRLSDQPWQQPTNSKAPGVIIAMCCRVGEARSKGYDVFGLVDLSERSDAAALVAPVISVDGIVGRVWSASFYEALSLGESIAAAVRSAARKTRERYPHPAFWSSLTCLGDPNQRLHA